MRVANAYKEGTALDIMGELCTIKEFTKDGRLNVLHSNDNVYRQYTTLQLNDLWLQNKMMLLREHKPVTDRQRRCQGLPFDQLPQRDRDMAMRAYDHVKHFINRKFRRRTNAILREVAQHVYQKRKSENRLVEGEKPIHERGFRRWLDEHDKNGGGHKVDVRVFLPKWAKSGNRSDRLCWQVEDIMERTVKRLRLIAEPESISDITHEIMRQVQLNVAPEDVNVEHKNPDGSVRVPSEKTVRRHCNSLDRGEVMEAHKGRRAREHAFKLVLPGIVATRPMEGVEIDSTPLHVIAIDYEQGVPLGRAYLTMAIDRYTRMIVGIYISFSAPSGRTSMKCLFQAMIPKQELLRKLQIHGQWLAMGHVETAITDLGRENGDMMAENLAAVDVDLQRTPVMTPRYKGRIERALRTILEKVAHKLPGTTFSNPGERGEYDSEMLACIGIDDLIHIVTKWVVCVYNNSFHYGIQYFPNKKWEEVPVEQRPSAPHQSFEELKFLLLTRPGTAKLTNHGIRAFGLRYSGKHDTPDVNHRVQAILEHGRYQGTVSIRYDEDDISLIHVLDPFDGVWFQLWCVFPDYADGISLRAHRFISKRAKAKIKEIRRVTIGELMQAKHEIRELVRSLVERRKYTRKKMKNVFDNLGYAASEAMPDPLGHRDEPEPRKRKSKAQMRRESAMEQFEQAFQDSAGGLDDDFDDVTDED